MQQGRGGRQAGFRPPEPPVIAGRVPPHDLDAEAAVLSAILLKRDALDQVLEVLKPEHFYSEANGRIYEAAMELAQMSQPIDTVTVASWLRDRERLQQIGGAAYLAQVVDATPAVAHVAAHARTVREKWRLRRVIAECQRIGAEGYGDVGDAQEFIDGAEQAIYALARTPESSAAQPIQDAIRAAFQQMQQAAARGDKITGASTGFSKLDEKTAGLHDGDLLIIAARPGMGKCLADDAEVVLADGRVVTMREIFEVRQAQLLTLGADWKLHQTAPSHFVDDGIKPVFRVTTRLGRRVDTTLSHPYLTVDGWRPLSELKVGDHVGVPRELPVFGDRPMRSCEIDLLGYLLGDGGLTGSAPTFTNTNPRLLQSFADAVAQFGACTTRRTDDGVRAPSLAVTGDAAFVERERPLFGARLGAAVADAGMTQVAFARAASVSPGLVSQWIAGACVPRGTAFERVCAVLGVEAALLAPAGQAAYARTARNPITRWLDELGLWGKGSHEKVVPPQVFQLPREQLARFLNRVFATDGWATLLASGQAQLGYATVSERLARQIQHLLLRFGVVASLRARAVKYREGRRPAWQLDVTHAASIRRFAEAIGIFGKEEALWRCVEAVTGRAEHANRDVIPAAIWKRLAQARGDESWGSVARRAGVEGSNLHVGKRGLSRRRLGLFARALDDRNLVAMSEGDVYFDEIVSIEPLGLRQVYDLTIPGTHNFIADDVCVHNTSFVLNLAVNIASPRTVSMPGPADRGYGRIEKEVPGFGCAIFTLEMPREQIATRMVCCEGRVDVGKVRSGMLNQDDWRHLTEAASYLSQLPIWVDDTPAIGLLEVRAKVRRMKAEFERAATETEPERKMGCIIIDYLQLMSGRPGVTSREQEISEISRGLKQLAKELKVPVIALSQLNRAVETRAGKDKRPQLSDLRECVTGDTLVLLADGRRVPIADLVGTTPDVLAVAEGGKVVASACEKVWRVGEREVLDVFLASGRRIRATAKHRLLGAGGWVRIGDLAAGARLALARQVPEPVSAADLDEAWSDARLTLLGHLVGDGSYLKHQPLRYTTASEDNSEAVAIAARDEFGAIVNRHEGRGAWHQLVLGGNGNRWHPRGLGLWLREIGIFGQRSHEKHLPADVFRLSRAKIALLLRHLWATDGTVFVRKDGSRDSPAVRFSTSSERLAGDVAALLLRLGIVARIHRVEHPTARAMFNVGVSGAEQLRVFVDEVGGFGPRAEPVRRLATHLEGKRGNTNVDSLPIETFDRVREVMRREGVSHRAMTAMRGTAHGGSSHFRFAPSREVIASYARLLGDAALERAATSDLFWDTVVRVEPAGRADVYDLTVPGPASWLADGIVSHNSGAIEQDADAILFIYRDEYYNPETTDRRGIAELILAKQRNGPTGKVLVKFTSSCTRFDNLQPGDYDALVGDDDE